MYRTGDRVRTLADGVLEFLGRIDFQGSRCAASVSSSARSSRRSPRTPRCARRRCSPAPPRAAGSRLAAYVVAEEGQAPTAPVLREALRERLPEYMVPNTFNVAARAALPAQRKVDRRALAAPAGDGGRVGGDDFAAPTTPAEKGPGGDLAEVCAASRWESTTTSLPWARFDPLHPGDRPRQRAASRSPRA